MCGHTLHGVLNPSTTGKYVLFKKWQNHLKEWPSYHPKLRLLGDFVDKVNSRYTQVALASSASCSTYFDGSNSYIEDNIIQVFSHYFLINQYFMHWTLQLSKKTSSEPKISENISNHVSRHSMIKYVYIQCHCVHNKLYHERYNKHAVSLHGDRVLAYYKTSILPQGWLVNNTNLYYLSSVIIIILTMSL